MVYTKPLWGLLTFFRLHSRHNQHWGILIKIDNFTFDEESWKKVKSTIPGAWRPEILKMINAQSLSLGWGLGLSLVMTDQGMCRCFLAAIYLSAYTAALISKSPFLDNFWHDRKTKYTVSKSPDFICLKVKQSYLNFSPFYSFQYKLSTIRIRGNKKLRIQILSASTSEAVIFF